MVRDDLKQAAEWIEKAAHNGGARRANQAEIYSCLESDLRLATERRLTQAECSALVLGDRGGDIPQDLVRQLPKTDAYIQRLFNPVTR